jgi:hypothetical protein
MQCTRAILTELVLPTGGMALNPFYWTHSRAQDEIAKDIEPSLTNTTLPPTPENVGFDCFDFAALETSFDTVDTCSDLGGLFADIDRDGTFDACDYFVSSVSDEEGDLDVGLKRYFRNQAFNESGPDFDTFADVDDVVIDSQSATILNRQADLLEFTLPSALTLGSQDVNVFDTGEPVPGIARDKLVVQRVGFISIGGADYVRPFDEATGGFVDLSPDFEDSVPDLPVDGPDGVAFSVEQGNENKELYVVAGSELFAYDNPNNHLRDLNESPGTHGALLGSEMGQLYLDPNGHFAFALHDGKWIGAVQVQKYHGGTEIALEERFSAYSHLTSVAGEATDLAVKRVPLDFNPYYPLAAPYGFAVYVMSSCAPDCDFDQTSPCSMGIGGDGMEGEGMMPMSGDNPIIPCNPETGDCGGGGPGGGGTGTNARSVFLSVRILRPYFESSDGPLLDATAPWAVACKDNIELSRIDNASGPLWSQIGLDFNSDGSELFVTNPDTDSLFILDTTTNELVPISPSNPNPLQIAVGVDPVDVEVLNVPTSGGVEDRAYVANHGDSAVADDDWLTIVDIDESQPAWYQVKNSVDLDVMFVDDLEISTAAGSEQEYILYLVSQNRQKVLMLDLSADGDVPTEVTSFAVGPVPRGVAVQE